MVPREGRRRDSSREEWEVGEPETERIFVLQTEQGGKLVLPCQEIPFSQGKLGEPGPKAQGPGTRGGLAGSGLRAG